MHTCKSALGYDWCLLRLLKEWQSFPETKTCTWKLEGVTLWSRIKIPKGSYRLFLTGLAKTFWTTANTLSLLLLLPPPWFPSCLLFLPPVRVNLVNVNSFVSPCFYLVFTQTKPPSKCFFFGISSIIPLLHSLSSRLMDSRSPCPLTLFTLILYTWSILLNQLSIKKWTRQSLTSGNFQSQPRTWAYTEMAYPQR